MSCIEYEYQKATHEDLLKLLKWSQNKLNLRDWTIYLDTGPRQRGEFLIAEGGDGEKMSVAVQSITSPERLRAWIWVSIDKCKIIDDNPYEVVLHEALHILLESTGVAEARQEHLIRRLSPLLYQLYCRETRRKIAKETD